MRRKSTDKKNNVFWDVKPCHSEISSWGFEGPQCLHLHGHAVFFDCFTLKPKTPSGPETPEATHPTARHQVPA